MLSSKFDGGNLTITMDEPLKMEVAQRGVNHQEIYRLVESFANNLLASKTGGQFVLTNEDTGASLEIDIVWQSATEVVVNVIAVDLNNVKLPSKPNIPAGAKVNLGTQEGN